MIYLDNGATSLHKPRGEAQAVAWALTHCANPGRGGHAAAMAAQRTVYRCRELAAAMFDCEPEQAVLTVNCTHGLNIAIRTLVPPGGSAVISGFEHNAVTRPLEALHAKVTVAGRRLFDWDDTLSDFDKALRAGADAAIVTHVSNVFGYILPLEEIAAMCVRYGVPLIVDAAQSAGTLPVRLRKLGAAFIAMPGHKGLLGPQGTGLLLCGRLPEPLLYGGTGSNSIRYDMPEFLPDRAEAGTLNVPGAAGLIVGMEYLRKTGMENIFRRECRQAAQCGKLLSQLGLRVYTGAHQGGTVSFVPKNDCEETAALLARRGIAVRAGLHCAPLAHESAGTLETGTVRVSFGHDASPEQTQSLLAALGTLKM